MTTARKSTTKRAGIAKELPVKIPGLERGVLNKYPFFNVFFNTGSLRNKNTTLKKTK